MISGAGCQRSRPQAPGQRAQALPRRGEGLAPVSSHLGAAASDPSCKGSVLPLPAPAAAVAANPRNANILPQDAGRGCRVPGGFRSQHANLGQCLARYGVGQRCVRAVQHLFLPVYRWRHAGYAAAALLAQRQAPSALRCGSTAVCSAAWGHGGRASVQHSSSPGVGAGRMAARTANPRYTGRLCHRGAVLCATSAAARVVAAHAGQPAGAGAAFQEARWAGSPCWGLQLLLGRTGRNGVGSFIHTAATPACMGLNTTACHTQLLALPCCMQALLMPACWPTWLLCWAGCLLLHPTS